ncbi:hypothetical protein KY320_01890 [Candidatus Woesearchaeota archaeon]|nr:hypothetical protein [Candidatus Woesearchaeota archaeon]
MNNQKKFTIMKKIAKHGNQAIIVIPQMLKEQLSPGTIVQLDIWKLSEEEE